MDNKLLTLSGPSGAGKTSLVNSLLAQHPTAQPLLRVTTRKPRESDSAAEYRYVPLSEFQELDRDGELLFPIEFKSFGVHNAMLRTNVEQALKSDQHLTVADLSFSAVANLMAYASKKGAESKIQPVFLDMHGDEHTLRCRMKERGEQKIEQRISECRTWANEARQSNVRFHFIDARQSKQDVLDRVLRLL